MSVSDRTAHFNGKEMVEMIASAVALLRMTPRDIGLIEVLNEVRYLTTAQVQRVCYPSASIQTHDPPKTRGAGLPHPPDVR